MRFRWKLRPQQVTGDTKYGTLENKAGTPMIRVFLVVLPLCLDTFAVSTTVGVLPLARGLRVQIAVLFAAAEGLMPAIGLVLGMPLGRAVGHWGSYLAGALLLGMGVWMWWRERQERAGDDRSPDDETARIMSAVTTGRWSLLVLALSVSLDELAVGFSFGLLGLPLIPVLLLIALQALLVGLIGQWMGNHLGKKTGMYAEQFVGPILCLIGAWFILAELLQLPF